jgi:hypothetical protein
MNSIVVRVTLCALLAPACYYPDDTYRSCDSGGVCPDGQSCGPQNTCVPGDGSTMGIDAASACDVSDPALRLCLTFDGDPLVRDLSSRPHMLAENIGVTSVIGPFGGRAAALNAASRIRFADSTDFDVTDLTIEMWFLPSSPQAKDHTLLDSFGQYSMEYNDRGELGCGIGNSGVLVPVTLTSGWHHVACRYRVADMETEKMRVYLDGNLIDCSGLGSGIPSTGTDGVAIGATYSSGTYGGNYVGSIDSVHLYARALTDAEICSAAHRTNCKTSCN